MKLLALVDSSGGAIYVLDEHLAAWLLCRGHQSRLHELLRRIVSALRRSLTCRRYVVLDVALSTQISHGGRFELL